MSAHILCMMRLVDFGYWPDTHTHTHTHTHAHTRTHTHIPLNQGHEFVPNGCMQRQPKTTKI